MASAVVCGSSITWAPALPSAARLAPSAAGSRISARSESASRTVLESLRPSMKSVGLPFAGRMAKASVTGLWAMSLPRMLKVQAIESVSASTAASACLLGDGVLQPGDLVGGGLAGQLDRVQRDRAQRRRRPVAPQAVDRVVVDRDEGGVGRLAGLGEAAHLGDGHQPRVVADAVACLEMGGQPLQRRVVDQVLGREQRRVGLGADLQGVAAVDEDRRLVGEHDRRAGRSFKPGQPCQALRRRAAGTRSGARRHGE